MSLLEDVFLEDEAGEAQELERVIEGDELDERPGTPDSNDASEKEDEAEEDKRVVDHNAKAKRVVKNPRFILNPARLTGPRGIQVIPEHFKDFQFKGKGHEREDLDYVLKKLEHWAYRLYPKFKFDDCLKKIETLGKKRPVMVHLHKIRTDQFVSEETVQQEDSSGDEEAKPPPEEDEFDRLLQQQIELARATPAPHTPHSVAKQFQSPMSTHKSPLMAPKSVSSPSISDEQKERMMRNRRLAEERRLARLDKTNETHNATADTHNASNGNSAEPVVENEVSPVRVVDNVEINDDIPVVRKHNRTNVIDSDISDDESDVMAVNESITVQIHTSVREGGDRDKVQTAPDAMAVESNENAISNDSADVNKSHESIKECIIEEQNTDMIETSDETIENENTEEPKETNDANNKTNEDINVAGDTDITKTHLENDKTRETIKTTTESHSAEIDSKETAKENAILSNEVDNSRVLSNKEAETGTEEVMDVDFSDDF